MAPATVAALAAKPAAAGAATSTSAGGLRRGKIVEFNSYPDIAGLMMQLGFMPQM